MENQGRPGLEWLWSECNGRRMKRQMAVEAAWTQEADAWNALASTANLAGLAGVDITLMPERSFDRKQSSLHGTVAFLRYRFVHIEQSDGLYDLCEQWMLT